MQQITVSENFKKMTLRAIASIALFIFTYIVLVCLAFILVGLCGLAGYALIAFRFTGITVMLAIGLVSMGVLILIFLFKFLFKKHVNDLTHFTEITRQQEPALFSLIEEIVQEARTDFPKKIYVSTDVNASVFYDSTFWSMILPVKKNLHVGIGLVNTVSITEFKAILAHEFGHFSQRTMKVGSYVYNVNQVIYNMLYDNESYGSMAQRWGNGNAYLTIFVSLAIRIVEGIQWILRKVYDILNLSYMSLSREMEFHADEVAANIAGSQPLITSLLRMELADHSFNEVLKYYGGKTSEAIKSGNIYPEQTFVMNFLAGKSKLPFENNLPQVTVDHLSRFNKSKLVIANQWASHPATSDRIHRLEKLNRDTRGNNTGLASELFTDIVALQVKLTEKLFSSIQYEAVEQVKTNDRFPDDFRKLYEESSFGDLYNSYYDAKNPVKIQVVDSPQVSIPASGPEAIFTSEAVDDVYTSIGLTNDISTLRSISDGSYPVKTFDYDGIKYTPGDCLPLITSLEDKLATVKAAISEHDRRIYGYFCQLAVKKEKEAELESRYDNFSKVDQQVESWGEMYVKIVTSSHFMFETTPFEVIRENLKLLKDVETDFKTTVSSILDDTLTQDSITPETRQAFNDYLADEYTYFYDQEYKSSELDILFTAINACQQVLTGVHFNAKKKLLDFQAELTKS